MEDMPNLWLVFTTGLLAGGVTCLAVQGGLLATAIASRSGEGNTRAGVEGAGAFLVAKLVSHVVAGFLLGALGGVINLSVTARGIMQLVLAVYMLGVAGAMLDLHPYLRYFILAPPKFLTRLVRNQSKSGSLFAPGVLGAMTILIPCGTTQAMMALAVGTGSPVWGALIMGVFVLGTSPLFLTMGTIVAGLGQALKDKFMKLAAGAIVFMALFSLSGALALLGTPVDAIIKNAYCTISFCSEGQALGETATNEVNLEILANGYKTDKSLLKAGSKITLNLINENARGCTQVFTIPKLGVNEVVSAGNEKSIEITVPETPGKLAFTCGMGMYSGEFTVVN